MKIDSLRIAKLCVLIALIFFVSMTLAGCTQKEESGKTTINFVTWKPNIPEVQEEIISIFESENPHIRIDREIGPHSSTAFHDLLTQKLKNKSTDVDVFLMDVIWPTEFAEAGWVMPLDERFSQAEKEKFLQAPIIANTYNGIIYGIPLFIDSGILYYRQDLLDKYELSPPETWQQLVDRAELVISEESRADNELYGFSGQFKQYEGLVCNMMEYILSNGGEILDTETDKPGIADAPALEAVDFVRKKIIGNIAPKGELTYQEPESLDLFIQGKAVFHRNWPYAWAVSNNPDRSRVTGKVGMARLPHFDNHRSISALGGWQVGISSYSENREDAWEFAKFLTSERVQKILAIKAGRAPTRKSLYEDPEILESYPHFDDMKDVFMTSYPRPRTPLYPAVSNALQRYFSKAISNPSFDIEEEAQKTSEEIEGILSLTSEE